MSYKSQLWTTEYFYVVTIYPALWGIFRFVFLYEGAKYSFFYNVYVGSLEKFHRNLLVTKSNDRTSDFVKGHSSRPIIRQLYCSIGPGGAICSLCMCVCVFVYDNLRTNGLWPAVNIRQVGSFWPNIGQFRGSVSQSSRLRLGLGLTSLSANFSTTNIPTPSIFSLLSTENSVYLLPLQPKNLYPLPFHLTVGGFATASGL